jgi:hypothetical protein
MHDGTPDGMAGLACLVGSRRRLRKIGVPVSGRALFLLGVACSTVPFVAVMVLDGMCFFLAQAGVCVSRMALWCFGASLAEAD